jgi:hypothetical protein
MLWLLSFAELLLDVDGDERSGCVCWSLFCDSNKLALLLLLLLLLLMLTASLEEIRTPPFGDGYLFDDDDGDE